MEQKDLRNVSILSFINAFPTSPNASLDEDFYILDAKLHDPKRILSHPYRLDAYMVIYCARGNIKLNVNLREYELKKGMLFLNFPGNIIRVNEIIETPIEDVRYFCMAISREFSQGLKMEVTKLFNEGVSMLENPGILLNDNEKELTWRHVDLLRSLLEKDIPYKKDAILSTLSSLFYVLMGVWNDSHLNELSDAQSTRSKVIFDKFMKLVSEYHTQYRNVGFYADKLCLTPKYLSKLIKNATGRSAPEWIDSYVILEAKNLLKYSGTTIKEIVYKLNFPNQSVFYKFFKARTGMTPTEYRNS
jgi:AraC-like DNA-binding protein